MDELLCNLNIYDLFTISADLDGLCIKYYEQKTNTEVHSFWVDVYNRVRGEIKDRYVDEYLKDGTAGKIVLERGEDGSITIPYPHLRKNIKYLSISGLKTLREDIDNEIERQLEQFKKEEE